MSNNIEAHNAEMAREFSRTCEAAAYRLPQSCTARVAVMASASIEMTRGRWGWLAGPAFTIWLDDETEIAPDATPEEIGTAVLNALKAAAVKAAEEADK